MRALRVVLVLALASLGNNAYGQSEQEFTGEGVVTPARSWDVSAEVSNKIKKIHFVRGQEVKKGDLLVEFDTFFKSLDVERAILALERAKAVLIQKEEALERQAVLKDRDAVSLAQYRDAEIAAGLARLDERDAQIALDMARTILSVQSLYAPFDGQMSEPRYRDNANVDISDGTEIATLVQLDPIHVLFREPYEDAFLGRLRAGETIEDLADRYTAELILPDGETYPHEGRIVSVAFDVDTKTGLASGLLVFANPSGVLRPGLAVKIVDRWQQ